MITKKHAYYETPDEPEAKPPARKVIHGFAAPTTGFIYIICDDGSLWRESEGKWMAVPGPA